MATTVRGNRPAGTKNLLRVYSCNQGRKMCDEQRLQVRMYLAVDWLDLTNTGPGVVLWSLSQLR